jgi:predicted nucleic acid-binding protein
MRVLLDSNILLRLAQSTHPMHGPAQLAVSTLEGGGDTLDIVPQNLYEFWVVATRPIANNGLGLTDVQASTEVARLRALFPLLDETPAVYPEWERLVMVHHVLGKNAHDAGLVAAMIVNMISHILTFNVADFTRFPSITVLDPATVAAPPTP